MKTKVSVKEINSNSSIVPEGKVVDYIDNTFRRDTPEEYVRQNIEKRIVNELDYPREQISIECGLKLGSAKPRADIVIFHKNRPRDQENINIIIECKKEAVSPADRKEGVGQLKSYMSACLNCEWGLWTNGKQREVYRRVESESGKVEFVEVNDIPSANGSLEDIDRPKRETLRNAAADNLTFAFKTAHNSIHVTDGLAKEAAFFELLKVIFCKIYDERNIPKPLEFYITTSERNNLDGQLAAKNRINRIFSKVKGRYSQIFDTYDEIKLNPRSLARIIAEFQGYSFLNTDIDIKGRAYEEIVGSNLKGDRGQFFTPRNMMHMAVAMINPQRDEKVVDPACGTGGFLVTAMNHVIDDLRNDWVLATNKKPNDWNDEEKRAFQEKVSEIAQSHFFGFDISPELVKATKMNMVMNNDGSGNILHTDSLLPPHEWSPEFKSDLARALNVHESSFINQNSLECMDIVVTNPPFGTKILIKDHAVLEQFDLGHIWKRSKENEGEWEKTDRLSGGVPPEQLFIERCLQFLKPGGRMAIVLPDSILGSPGLGYIRQWLLAEARLLASIDLDSDTFQPHTGVQTSILLLQKKTVNEKKLDSNTKYNVFMAVVDKVGHDKRGNVTYLRDNNGNELLVPVVGNPNDSGENKNGRVHNEKVVDDQSVYIPSIFKEWKSQEHIKW